MEKIAIPVKNATITEPKQDVPSEKKVLIATRVDEPYFAVQSQNPVDSPDDALPMIPVQNLIVNDEPSVRKMQKICELVNPTAGGDILSQDLTNFSNHEHPTIFNQMEDEDYYYIKQTDVKIMYEEYNSVNGFSIPKCSATNLARQLANADIIVPIAEGKTVRFGQKIPGHGNTRYMKLNKLKLLQSASI